MREIKQQLNAMAIKYDRIVPMRCKSGIYLYRVFDGSKSYVLKFFANALDRREIRNYSILHSLSVPTMDVLNKTDCCLLLEDIERSCQYRLGTPGDLQNPNIAAGIATWYRQLHDKGNAFVDGCKDCLYDENDVITEKNLERIMTQTATTDLPVWELLLSNLDRIQAIIVNIPKTLNYNDFYYTNLIVSKDESSAFMFDYNLLGKGYAYADIRNVCYSLGEHAKAAFLQEYGPFDESQKIVDDVASTLVSMHAACKFDVFPSWAQASVQDIKQGLLHKVQHMLDAFP